ncbi:MAG TPA: DUF998 domain-containing protein [Candidatus Sulfotelmatobacter sp.]|nr:DUF998 domain-containing protein [Candidatus Sulfotelmatobacter sp.]
MTAGVNRGGTSPSIDRIRLGAASWLATPLFFAGQIVAQAAWKGSHYSILSNAISDLGVTACGNVTIVGSTAYYCSPLHAVMNGAFLVTGACLVAGAFLTWGWWQPGRRSLRAGIAMVAIAGAGKALVGFEPIDVNAALHVVGSIGMPLGNIGLVLVAVGLRGHASRLAWFSLVSGVIGSMAFALFLGTNNLAGLWERVASYPVVVWCVVAGLWIIAATRVERPAGHPRDAMTSL